MNYNDNDMPMLIIKTARTEKAINAGVKLGFWPLVKPVIPSKKIKSKFAVYQDRVTGKVEVVGDIRNNPNQNQDIIIVFKFYYPHSFTSPFAAYLIPEGLQPGTKVYLEDLIEDIEDTCWNQGDCYRLDAAPAVWDGKDFIIERRRSSASFIVG